MLARVVEEAETADSRDSRVEAELVQGDTSDHDWLERRGERMWLRSGRTIRAGDDQNIGGLGWREADCHDKGS
jgi:hypothetical protein